MSGFVFHLSHRISCDTFLRPKWNVLDNLRHIRDCSATISGGSAACSRCSMLTTGKETWLNPMMADHSNFASNGWSIQIKNFQLNRPCGSLYTLLSQFWNFRIFSSGCRQLGSMRTRVAGIRDHEKSCSIRDSPWTIFGKVEGRRFNLCTVL